MVEDLLTEESADGRRESPACACAATPIYRAPAVVLTTGTFLQALMHTGEAKTPGGRGGEGTTTGISAALARLGFQLARFKTGTPPRLNGRTIDFDRMRTATGRRRSAAVFVPDRQAHAAEQLPCWITYTNEAVHDLIRANLHRAPMYSGQINSSGPRYCPSIEDKVVRFADKAVGTSSSWSPKDATRTKSTSTASRPACRATCKTPCSG